MNRPATTITRLALGHFFAPGTDARAGSPIVVVGYLVRHPVATLLFDTGIGTEPETDAHYRTVHRPIEAALAGAGLAPADVDLVANCHLHVDHAGQNERFPGIPIHVQSTELALARSGEHTTSSAYDFPGATFVEHSGEAELLPGVTLIPTPGHTPGHQALAIDTPGGTVVLAGQSFNEASTFATARLRVRLAQLGADPGSKPEVPSWMTRVAGLEPVRVLFAHDEAAWLADD